MQVQDTNSSFQTNAFDLIEQQTQDDVSSSSVSSSSPVEVKTNIVFNPLQHRTQGGSRDLSYNPKQILLKKAQQFQIEEESSENSTDKRRYKDDLIKGRRVIHAVLIKEY
ncbi:hypothetical protein GLOIN_2v1489550 [Rhizophagus irregularis DAOM 181602=DAOM 197198]|nr:hypothetical protein GLOIN_2v1489550 [Rhizophagus irregularis DAOM 181602=DAOM 197198]